MKVNLWRNASNPARPRPGQPTIRGKTISNPIPIPSPLDDNFIIRNPGTGMATPVGPTHESDHQLVPPPQPGTSAIPIPYNQQQEQQLPDVDSGSGSQQGPMPMPSERDPPSLPIPEEPMSREYHSRGQSFSATLPRPSTSPPRQGNSPPTHDSSPPRPRDSPPRGTNVNSTLRYSTVSAASTGHTDRSREAPQRKKSTLRTALGRLFGRRKKQTTSSAGGSTDSHHLAQTRTTSQHRSDPTALGNRPGDRERGPEPKRSASLPITEFDRALRSHSVGADDITAIESARNSLQADTAGGRRRAATTSSRLYPTQRMDGWSGLSPRPASTHGRGSRLLSAMELEGAAVGHDPNEIGRAITSDLGSRRRSRSLSGLEDMENNQLGDVRKRSDEIRYWRESYDQGFLSPLSSGAPEEENDGGGDGNGNGEGEGEGREDRDNDNKSDNNDDAHPASGAVVLEASSMTMHPHPFAPPSQQPQASRTPPQPFTFPGTVASMNEMAGMKITHAASMETRIHSLESRMHALERVVNEFCHNSPGFTMPPPDSPAPRRPVTAGALPAGAGLGIAVSEDERRQQQQQQPASSFTTATTSVPPIPAIYSTLDNSSHLSFGEAPTFTESIHRPHAAGTAPISAIPSSFFLQSGGGRPTSNSTVRGATSLPQLHTPPPMTSEERDNYVSLIDLITAEQSARMALEAKVRTLSRRIDFLSSSSSAAANNGSGDATPQRHIHLPVHQQEVPGTAKSLGTFSAFDDDSDDNEVDDNDDDDEDRHEGGSVGLERESTTVEIPVEDDASYSEAFQTPREEVMPGTAYSYGAFGEELRDDDGDGGSRRKAARTLSLSQLTLGKGQTGLGGGEEIPQIPATPTTGPLPPSSSNPNGVNF